MEKVAESTNGNTFLTMESLGDLCRSCLEYIWRVASNGADIKEFDRPSFLTGMCLGTASCIVLGRIMRSVFLIAAGGIVTTALLRYYGAISLNVDAVKAFLRESATDTQSKVKSALHGTHKFVTFVSSKLIEEDIPRGHVISGLMGTAAGFGLGLILL